MGEIFTDYVIVNVSNYKIENNKTLASITVSELKCLPLTKNHALCLSGEESIDKYVFSTILPLKIDKNKSIGARVLCKKDDSGAVEICYGKVDYNFYERCRNIATLIEEYNSEVKNTRDSYIISHLVKILFNMLADRMRKIFASQNNLALLIYGEQSIEKMYQEIIKLENLTGLVGSVEKIEKEMIKNKSSVLER